MNPSNWWDELLRRSAHGMSVELLARFLFVLTCAGACAVIWRTAPISLREKKAAIAAGIVHILLACGIELFVLHYGVYRYVFSEYMLWGIPVDIHAGWAALWGAGLCMVWQSVRGGARLPIVAGVIAATVGFDFAALATGVVFEPLTRWWWVWDAAALAVLALATLAFYTLIVKRRALYLRAAVYALAYAFLFYLLLPAMAVAFGRGNADFASYLNVWTLTALGLCSVPGAIAAAQFARSGGGSPLPLDPTRKLVTCGIYAHVRNPMQLSGAGATLVWALAVRSWPMWIYCFDLVVLLQFVLILESRELEARFGSAYEHYRRRVRLWLPRWSAYKPRGDAG